MRYTLEQIDDNKEYWKAHVEEWEQTKINNGNSDV